MLAGFAQGLTMAQVAERVRQIIVDDGNAALDTWVEVVAQIKDNEDGLASLVAAVASKLDLDGANIGAGAGTLLTALGFSAFVQGLNGVADAAAFRTGIGLDFSGALVRLSANATIVNSTATAIAWSTELEDAGGWWTGGAPSRLTVPAGISRVRVKANIRWDTVAAGVRSLEIYKNGAAFAGGGAVVSDGSGSGSTQQVCSAPIAVSPGDYFQALVTHTRGSDLSVLNSSQTFFSIEAVR
jgi:hypothetical protein